MTDELDPVAYNRAAWDREVDSGNEWTRPVGPEVTARARAGDWSVVLIGYEPVPRDWFPADLAGVPVLCLASGGGQQGPVVYFKGANALVGARLPQPVEDHGLRRRHVRSGALAQLQGHRIGCGARPIQEAVVQLDEVAGTREHGLDAEQIAISRCIDGACV